jgi:hypothetical protein
VRACVTREQETSARKSEVQELFFKMKMPELRLLKSLEMSREAPARSISSMASATSTSARMITASPSTIRT